VLREFEGEVCEVNDEW